MKANFGLLPTLALEKKTGKRERGQLYADRASITLANYLDEND
jgi:folate-dependent tRNA-U54 methylase TrmFO/GidA